MTLNRRSFLKTTALTTAGFATAGLASPLANAALKEKPLFDISLAEWSLHNALFGRKGKKIDALDFAVVAKKEFGISAVEHVNQFFKDKASDEKYLAEMKKRADDNGVKSLLIMIDREGNLGDPNSDKRTQAVENHYKWVEAAKFLGCHSIRVNAASSGSWDEQVKLAADGLRRLSEFGDKHGINVIVENHGGLSSNGEWLSAVMKAADHKRCGTLPDFGNFVISRPKGKPWERYDNLQGVKDLMPFAKGVSFKTYDFDDSKPFITIDHREKDNVVELDCLKLVKACLDAGYTGHIGIEYEGHQLDEPTGIRKSKEMLERIRKELA